MRVLATLLVGVVAWTVGVVGESLEKCVEIGPCETCAPERMHKQYCQDTGKRVQMQCVYGEGEERRTREQFAACTELSGTMDNFVWFQACMVAVGGAAFYLIKQRKLAAMTPYGYDYRRVSGGGTAT